MRSRLALIRRLAAQFVRIAHRGAPRRGAESVCRVRELDRERDRRGRGAADGLSRDAVVRQDGGEAQTGYGLDIGTAGSGLSWSQPANGITAEVSGRVQIC